MGAAFLENQHGQLIKDIADLKVEVEETAGSAASFIESFAQIAAQKAELEKQLQEVGTQIGQETVAKNQLAQQKKLVEMDVGEVKNQIRIIKSMYLMMKWHTRNKSLLNSTKRRRICKSLMQRMLKILEV